MTTQDKSSRHQHEVRPLPAAIARPGDPKRVQSRAWRITHDANGMGSTDLANHVMSAPLGESDLDFAVRAHEMLHVKWSPLPDAPMDSYTLAAEDGRIESLATMAGFTRPETHPGKSIAADFLAAGDYSNGMLCAVAVVGSPGEAFTREALAALGSYEATFALDLMDWAAAQYAADHSWSSTELVASRLRELCEPPESSDDDSDGEPGEPGESDSEPGEPAGDSDDSDGEPDSEPVPGEHKPDSKPVPSKPAGGKPDFKPADMPAHAPRPVPEGGYGDGGTGTAPAPAPKPAPKRDDSAKAGDLGEAMPVDMAELTESMPIAEIRPAGSSAVGASTWSRPALQVPARPVHLIQDERGRKRSKATDYGTVPTRMHRAAVDDRVFTARKHRRQGTVLIDMSGSMSVSAEQIAELIHHAPAAVVAGYWGRNGTGILRILASGGRMVDDKNLRPTGMGNEIDGPALAWLARQRSPRIWICDGALTGTGDQPVSPELAESCHRIERQARIRRIGSLANLDQVKRWLR